MASWSKIVLTACALIMVVLSRLVLLAVQNKMAQIGDKLHFKCRNGMYPRSEVKRFPVPDEFVKWTVKWPEYNPPEYTSPTLTGQPWADLEIGEQFAPKFNEVEVKAHVVRKNRISYAGNYQVVSGYPLNPIGRTGIRGRGLLGRWGPNHAADAILTRWVLDEMSGKKIVNQDSKKPILQFVGIQRRHGGEWAIPGGMLDAGEEADHATQREFLEETMNSEKLSEEELETSKRLVLKMFSKGTLIYQGYVDDPRNTDNAWMETTATTCHVDGPDIELLHLKAGSDAKQVAWLEISSSLNLYASHIDLVKLVAELHGAHW